VLVCIYLEKLS